MLPTGTFVLVLFIGDKLSWLIVVFFTTVNVIPLIAMVGTIDARLKRWVVFAPFSCVDFICTMLLDHCWTIHGWMFIKNIRRLAISHQYEVTTTYWTAVLRFHKIAFFSVLVLEFIWDSLSYRYIFERSHRVWMVDIVTIEVLKMMIVIVLYWVVVVIYVQINLDRLLVFALRMLIIYIMLTCHMVVLW